MLRPDAVTDRVHGFDHSCGAELCGFDRVGGDGFVEADHQRRSAKGAVDKFQGGGFSATGAGTDHQVRARGLDEVEDCGLFEGWVKGHGSLGVRVMS